ncbi:hypothetical protein ACFY7Y_14335 [Streptomyces virginiae]|uniref:hypothetical protein n=1 Tax=Streptomyces virginiae TaxID=1961 RepID=UPI003689F5D2
MADEWNAFEQLRHAVLTEVPPEMGDGSWCLKDAWQAMRGARDFKPQYSFVIKQLDRLATTGVLRLEAGVYVPVTPVHRPGP